MSFRFFSANDNSTVLYEIFRQFMISWLVNDLLPLCSYPSAQKFRPRVVSSSFPLLRGAALVQKVQPGFIFSVILIGADGAPAIGVHGRSVLARHHVLDFEVFAVQVRAGGAAAAVHMEGVHLESVGQEGLLLCFRLHPGQLCPHEPFGSVRRSAVLAIPDVIFAQILR